MTDIMNNIRIQGPKGSSESDHKESGRYHHITWLALHCSPLNPVAHLDRPGPGQSQLDVDVDVDDDDGCSLSRISYAYGLSSEQ
ncbi:GL14924 [Drosophila persimilis]|uniref:GL14924 n=1 Tax=Drosophila persimilis TaxID=7234 RepID=B4GQ10_DROPE|nr:GL14924 [Drosophila persimilis]